jgi:hypothetical protein
VVLFNVNGPDGYVEMLRDIEVKSDFTQFVSVIIVEVMDVFVSVAFLMMWGSCGSLLCLQFYLS